MSERKIYVSEETRERLEREMEEMLSHAMESEGSVGSAVKVVYSKEFANEYNIGRYGRMTLKEDKRIYHAGSRTLDDKPMFQYVEQDYARIGCRFREGQDLQLNLDKFVDPDEWPEPLYQSKNWGMASIEKELFVRLGGIITLVNPSFRTMQALDSVSSKAVKAYVHLTNTFDMTYYKGVCDFVDKSSWLEMSSDVKGVAYLGSGQPNYYPTVPWVRLIPSPYIMPCSQFQQFVSHWDERGYSCTYERKPGYFVNNMLHFDTKTYVYNPETVDQSLPDPGRPGHLAFLESSYPLKMIERDERRIYHKPRFFTIPEEAEWQQVGDETYLLKGNCIYDKKGPGTYFSRRSRDVPPSGLSWVPYSLHGSHWLTLSSTRPRRDYNVEVHEKGKSTFVCFGNTRPVFLERILSTQVLWIDEREAPTKEKAVTAFEEVGILKPDGSRGQKGPVNSKSPSHEQGNKEMEIRSEYWKDSKGNIYPHELRREDGIAWLHQLNHIPGIAAHGQDPQLNSIPRFTGRSGISFMDVTGLRAGTYYLCPNREYLVQMIPQATKYYSRNYLNVFTYGPYAKAVEIDGEEYQSKMNPEWNAIILEFQKTVVTNRGNNARTELAVAETLGMSLHLVTKFIRVHPDMRIWKVGVNGLAQWVYRTNNRVRFPDGDDLEGHYWEDVMTSRHIYTTKHDVSEFRKYCLNNGYGFVYHDVSLDRISFQVKGRK